MSRIFKFTVILAICTCAFVGLGFLTGYKGGGLLVLILLTPVLWTLWLACAAIDLKHEKWKLILLWALIDIAVLGTVILLSVGHKPSGRGGDDYFFLIAFSPIILPALLATACVPIFGEWLSAIGHGASGTLLPGGIANVLADWLSFSILSAVSSCLFVSLCYGWKLMRENKRQGDKAHKVGGE